jgi:predicted ATPase
VIRFHDLVDIVVIPDGIVVRERNRLYTRDARDFNWAFSPSGEASIAVALAVAAVPMWFQTSRFDACRGWMEKALGVPVSPRGSTRST